MSGFSPALRLEARLIRAVVLVERFLYSCRRLFPNGAGFRYDPTATAASPGSKRVIVQPNQLPRHSAAHPGFLVLTKPEEICYSVFPKIKRHLTFYEMLK
jgi:hypothetical protein